MEQFFVRAGSADELESERQPVGGAAGGQADGRQPGVAPRQAHDRGAGGGEIGGRGAGGRRGDPQVDTGRGAVRREPRAEGAPPYPGRLVGGVPDRPALLDGRRGLPAIAVAEAGEPVPVRTGDFVAVHREQLLDDLLEVVHHRHLVDGVPGGPQQFLLLLEGAQRRVVGALQIRTGRHAQYRARPGPRRGLRSPSVDQHRRRQGDSRHVRGVAAERVEARGVGDHPVDRYPPVARLEADHSAVRGGPDHRADGLCPDGQRHHPGGDRGRRTTARTARRMRRVVRIARRARGGDRELRGHGLARDQRPGGAQPVDDGGLRAAEHLGRQRRARAGGQPVDPHDVLDAHGDAMEDGPAGGVPTGCGPPRRLQEPRTPPLLRHEGPHLRIDRVDAVAGAVDRVDGVVRAGPQRRGFLDEGSLPEQVRHAARLQPASDSGGLARLRHGVPGPCLTTPRGRRPDGALR
ncbi:hypothetical protein BG653_02851 [Streptomyces platensis]|uniref:Uncharacterized protein n=1 Tax=Streptomyces platensis TaxID=58346 RepID=A0ABX3XYW5_STRPT|nr:hypothetical protein BG653_02851 [Streptomyces platensis]